MDILVKKIDTNELYLRQVSKEVDFSSNSYLNDIEMIREYCSKNSIMALSAVQIGIPKRIIYLKNTNVSNLSDELINEGRILINPIIKSKKGLTKYWEACASCLDNMGLVTRPYEIEVEYKNIYNQLCEEIFTGFEATVLSHECDHLDGILLIDKADEILQMTKEERIEFRKTHSYTIISENLDFHQYLKTKKH